MAWPLLSLVKRTPSATRRASAARRRACRRLVDAPHRFERLEPRLLLSDVQWTGNGDGTSWDDANNWEVDGAGTGVPQAGDDVTIDVVAPTTVVLDSGATSVAINSLTTNAAFTISSRTLTINGPATFDAGLTMSGGTINGTGNIAISNASFDWTFGTIGGTGTITVSGGMNLSGNSNKIVDGKEMILDSNTTWSAGVWQVRNGAVITNQATHTVDIQANLNLDDATTGGTETFNNFGTVQKSALTGDARLEPSFDNKSTGVVHAMVGTIEFDGNVVNAGGLTADLDAIVEFSVSGGVYDLDAGTTVTGAGEIRLVQGALNINTPLTFATGYAQSGGTLGGTENLEIAGPLTWTAGTIAGTRTITISGGLAASGSGTKIQSFATLSLDSNTTWSNGVWRLQDGAVIDNLATHTFDIQGNLRLDVPSAQTGEFNNFGTIQKSGGTGDSVFEPVFDNKGASVVHSMSGTIEFAGDVTSAGRFTADVGDAVEINAAGKMINLDAGTTVTGDGALVLTRGLFNVIAPLAFDADFRLTGGQVDAQAALTLNGLFTWTAGTVIGAGGIVASGGTTLSTTGTKILDGSTLSLDSDTDWVAGVWRVTGDGAVDNRATRTLDIQGNFSLDVPSGQTGSFDNFGTVMKTDGTGDSLLETTFDNKSSGVVHSMSGTIEFARSVTSSGRFTADDGDRVEINAAGFQIDLDAGTTVTGAGEFRLTRGFFNLNAALAVEANLAQTGGIIQGDGDLTTNGVFNWGGGTIAGGGALLIAGGLQLSTSGTKILDGRTADLDSNTQWSAGVFRLQNGAVVNNLATRTFELTANLTLDDPNGTTGTETFNNFGTFTRTGGTSTSTVEVAFNNHSSETVTTSVGTLNFTGNTTSVGRWQIDSPALLQWSSATHSWGAGTVIAGTGTARHNSGTLNVDGNTTIDGLFQQTGGTMTVHDPAVLDANGMFTVSGGTLTGDGPIVFDGPLAWTAGTIAGTGSTTINGGLTASGSTKVLNGRPLTLDSDTTWTAGTWQLTGGADIDNQATRIFDIQGNLTLDIPSGATNTETFNNFGTVQRSAGTGTMTFEAILDNKASGSVTVDTGVMTLNGGSESAGAWQVNTTLKINRTARSFNFGSGTTFTGTGVTELLNGTMVVTDSVAMGTSFEMDGGTIQADGTLTVTGPTSWTTSSVTGAGNLRLEGGLTLNGFSTRTVNGGTVDLDSDTTWTQGTLAITGGGTVNNLSGSTFNIDANLTIDLPFGQIGTFNNAGTVVKSSTGTVTIEPDFANTSSETVRVDAGTLRVIGNSTTSGAWQIADGAILEFATGAHELSTGTAITGPGLFKTTSGSLDVTAAVTIAAPFEMSGNVQGDADLTLDGPFTWRSGTMSGTPGLGKTIVNGGADLQFSTKTLDGRTLDLESDTVWSAGTLQVTGDGVINNLATRTFDIQAALNLDDLDGIAGADTFNNLGAVTMTGTFGQATIETDFVNANSVTVQNSGTTLGFRGDVTSTGTWDLPTATTLLLTGNGATYDLDTGTSITGTGTVRINNGTMNVNDDLALPMLLKVQGGRVEGNGTLTTDGALEWTGGVMADTDGDQTTGRTVVNGGLTIQFGLLDLDGRVLDLDSDTAFNSGELRLSNGAVVNNLAGRTVTIGDFITIRDQTPATPGTWNNVGTVSKISGFSNTTFEVPFDNQGVVDIQSGAMVFNALSNFDDATDTLTGGTFLIVGTLRFTGARVVTNAATIVLDGASARIQNELFSDALTSFAENTAAGDFTTRSVSQFLFGPFSNAGAMTIESATFSLGSGTTDYTQTAGSTTLIGGTLTAATVDIQGGTLGGDGTINGDVVNAATVDPGQSPGRIAVNGTYDQTAAGTLAIEIAGPPTTPGVDYDQLDVTGTATLAGTLNVTVAPGVTLVESDVYDILPGATSGSFEAVNLVGLPVGFGFDVEYQSVDLHVLNAIPNDLSDVEEGDGIFVLFSIEDPGAPDQFSATIDFGDGTVRPITSIFQGSDGRIAFDSSTYEYADNGEYEIFVNISNNTDMVSMMGRTTITVDNAEPIVDAGPNRTVDEGDTVTLSGGATDVIFTDRGFSNPTAGTEETFTASVDWGDSTVEPATVTMLPPITFPGGQPRSRGRLDAAHAYPDDGEFTVQVTVIDDDGGSHTDSFLVTVSNGAPVIDPFDDLVAEQNVPVDLNFTFSDPGVNDTHVSTIFWGDNQSDNVDPATSPVSQSHTFTSGGIFDLTVNVTDNSGDGDTVPRTVFVSATGNTAPMLSLDAVTGSEGEMVTLNGTFTDPDSGNTHDALIDWGDGTFTSLSGVASPLAINHVYHDDGDFTITVRVNDSAGGVDTESTTATIANRDPALAPFSNKTADEGESILLQGSFTDAANDDFSILIDWGDGTSEFPVDELLVSGAGDLDLFSFAVNHVYADDGQYTVTVTVTDDDGGSDQETLTVTVDNVDPNLVTENLGGVNEGGTFTIDVGTFSDPGFDNAGAGTMENFTATIDWGDGTVVDEVGTVVEVPGGPGQPTTGTVRGTHAYADHGDYPVTVTMRDDDGNPVQSSFTLTVGNVAPTVTAIDDPAAINEGDTFNLPTPIAMVSDPGFDTLEIFQFVTIDWGDGSPPESVSVTGVSQGGPDLPTTAEVRASHPFPNSGEFTVTVTAQDNAGETGLDTFTVTAINLAPTANPGGAHQVPENGTVQLDGSGTDPSPVDEAGLTYQWDLDGDGIFGETGADATRGDETLEDPIFDASGLPSPGPFRVELKVTDPDGAQSDPVGADITIANAPPAVNVGGPYTVKEGGSATLTLSIVDVDPIVTVEVDLDDDGVFNEADSDNGDETARPPVFEARDSDAGERLTVTVRATDVEGAAGIGTAEVMVVEPFARVDAVVPMPFGRDPGNALTRQRDQIVVHLNTVDLDPESAGDTGLYQLIDTNRTLTTDDDTMFLPSVAIYDAETDKVTLTFDDDLAEFTPADQVIYRLRVGTDQALPGPRQNVPVLSDPEIGNAFDLGPISEDVRFEATETISTTDDVDFYQFTVEEDIQLTVTVLADAASAVDPFVKLFEVRSDGTHDLLAQNDDTFDRGSLLDITLPEGDYALGVTASGNWLYDPATPNTGADGNSTGDYTLSFDASTDEFFSLLDVDGLPLDGDQNGEAGGVYDFYMFVTTPANTIVVDGVTGTPGGAGTLADPVDGIAAAIAMAIAQAESAIAIAGHGGPDSDLSTLSDNFSYPIQGDVLVPKDTHVAAHPGTVFEFDAGFQIVVGSDGATDRSGATFQALGTPAAEIGLFSSNPNPNAGDWGGITFRGDIDQATGRLDPTNTLRFINYLNHTTTSHATTAVTSIGAQPTITNNTVRDSSGAAFEADWDSFAIGGPNLEALERVFRSTQFFGNATSNNSINGVRVTGTPTLSLRFDDVDITHVIDEEVAFDSITVTFDPGLNVKLDDGGLHFENATLNAEGRAGEEIVFTSVDDDARGATGPEDTNNDGPTTGVSGDWDGLHFSDGSKASLNHVIVDYAGGQFTTVPSNPAAIDIDGALLTRIDNSTISNHGDGNGFPTVFINNAQPTIVNNEFRNNEGAAISADPNSFTTDSNPDPYAETVTRGLRQLIRQLSTNRGPAIRNNLLDNNGINGMVVRGGMVATETVWDDTDIVHVLPDEITVPDGTSLFGLPNLVIQADAQGGITATGQDDGLTGGIVGLDGVAATSLKDDAVRGDTNNDGNATTPGPGDWGGITFRGLFGSNNVDRHHERENHFNPGANNVVPERLGTVADPAVTFAIPQFDGILINGHLADAGDRDRFTFSAIGGDTLFIDVDDTGFGLDPFLELFDDQNNIIASADDNNPTGVGVTPLVEVPDNGRDPGMQWPVPGTAGQVGTYTVDVTGAGSGFSPYQLQIRRSAADERAGSGARYSYFRYADTGLNVDTSGLTVATGEHDVVNLMANDIRDSNRAIGLDTAGQDDPDVLVLNSVIVNNGGGIGATGSGTPDLTAVNNTIWNELNPAGTTETGIDAAMANLFFWNSLVAGFDNGVTGTNVTGAFNGFKDNGVNGPTGTNPVLFTVLDDLFAGNGSPFLAVDSLAIDAGTNTSGMPAPARDGIGVDRDGFPDLGALEFTGLTVQGNEGAANNVTVTFNPTDYTVERNAVNLGTYPLTLDASFFGSYLSDTFTITGTIPADPPEFNFDGGGTGDGDTLVNDTGAASTLYIAYARDGAGEPGGIFRSDDMGTTWQRLEFIDAGAASQGTFDLSSGADHWLSTDDPSTTGNALITLKPLNVTGSHEFQTRVEIGGDVDVDAGNGGDRLEFNNRLSLQGNTLMKGGAGNDLIISNRLSGGGGTISGGTGDDTLIGGDGDDSLDGGDGDDSLDGGDGDDTLFGDAGMDTLEGNAGRDDALGGDDDDLMIWNNGDGSDRVVDGNGGDNTLDVEGSDGPEQFFIFGGGGGTMFIGLSDDQGSQAISPANINAIDADGNDGDDTLDAGSADPGTSIDFDGNRGNDLVFAGQGESEIEGGAGNDTLIGGPGPDTLIGGSGADVLNGKPGNDILLGGPDDDFMVWNDGDGNDFIDGGRGTDQTRHFMPTLDDIDATISDLPDMTRVVVKQGQPDEATTDMTGVERAEIFTGGGNDTLIGNLTGADPDLKEVLFVSGSGGDLVDNSQVQAGGPNVTVDGGLGNDTLIGGPADDKLIGSGGDDSLIGGAGNDTLLGGAGLDTLAGEAGDDSLDGGSEPDTLLGGVGNDTLLGGEENDSLIGGDDADTLLGDAGDDTLSGEGGADTISGGTGADLIDGGTEGDSLLGNEGDDTLLGGVGVDDDTLIGGAGNDDLGGGEGDDSIDGGSGSDIAFGDDGNDTISGGDDADLLIGDIGSDSLDGGGGPDLLFGDVGDDTLAGGADDDTLDGGTGSDTLLGEAGNDTLLGGPGVEADSLSGGIGNDSLVGDAGNDTLAGDAGNDTLSGGTGADVLDGGTEDDSLLGGDGTDSLLGDAGEDTILGGSGDDMISGGNGNDLINGDAVDESATGNDTINGGEDDDTITGWNGDDVINGDEGNDDLRGGFGNDTVLGAIGSDTLDGGRGMDSLDGDGGFNELVTDKLFFEYNQNTDMIVDVAITGGLAWTDEFVAITVFDDVDGDPGTVNTGDGIEGQGSLTPSERLDIRSEMLGGSFPGTDSDLRFSDYDGGDGPDGDVLRFLDSQLDPTSTARVDDRTLEVTTGTNQNDDLDIASDGSVITIVSNFLINPLTGCTPGSAVRGPGLFTVVCDENEVDDIVVVSGGGDDDINLAGTDIPSTILAGRGNDTVLGSGGDDTMIWFVDDGTNIADGGTGNDTQAISGSFASVDDLTVSTIGNRIAVVDTGTFTLDIGTTESLDISTGDGSDTILVNDLAGASGLTFVDIDAGGGDDGIDLSTVSDFGLSVTIAGGTGADNLLGSQGPDVIDGGLGGGTIVGNGGDDDLRFTLDTAAVNLDITGGAPGGPGQPGDTVTVDLSEVGGDGDVEFVSENTFNISSAGGGGTAFVDFSSAVRAKNGKLNYTFHAGPDRNDGTTDELRVVRNGARLEFFVNGTRVGLDPNFDASVNRIEFSSSGDVTNFVVDFGDGNPIPVGGIGVTGTNAGDQLTLSNGTPANVTHDLAAGTITVDGNTISYAGLSLGSTAPIIDILEPTDRTFSLTEGTDSFLFTNPPVTDRLTVNGLNIRYQRSTNMLTINSGGDDDQGTIKAGAVPAGGAVVDLGGQSAGGSGDKLRVDGTGNETPSMQPGEDGAKDGVVQLDGTRTITFKDLEPDTLTLTQFASVTLVTPGDEDVVSITSDAPGENRVSGTSDGFTFVSLVVFDVGALRIDTATNDGASGDDAITVSSDGIVATALNVLQLDTGAGSNTLDIDGGTVPLDASVGAGGANLTVNVNHSGTILNLVGTQRLQSLDVDSGALVNLPASGEALEVETLSITGGAAPTGTVNIHGSGLIVNYDDAGVSPLALHDSQITSARDANSPALWTGPGITSADAAADPSGVTVTAQEASDLFGAAGGDFFGVPVAAGDDAVLIRTVPVGGGPRVIDVLVRGAAWTPDVIASLSAQGLGEGGFALDKGSNDQFRPVPYPGIDQLLIRFDRDVVIATGDVSVTGTNVADYAPSITYDAATFTATATLAQAVDVDALTLAIGEVVTDLAQNALDGEWTDGVSTTSGDGQAGGAFSYRLNVLPSDFNRDFVVGADDLQAVLSLFTQSVTLANHVQADITGPASRPDGVVGTDELQAVLANFTRSLPMPTARASASAEDVLGQTSAGSTSNGRSTPLSRWQGWIRPAGRTPARMSSAERILESILGAPGEPPA